VEVPLSTASLVVVRQPDAAPTQLTHLQSYEGRLDAGEWHWFRLPLLCSAGSPLPSCEAGELLAASVELDTNFNASLLRYESVYALLAHEQVLEPTETDAVSCFDGLEESQIGNLAAGYTRRGAEPEVNGFDLRTGSGMRGIDRLTFHVGSNMSSGGCNALLKQELLLRVRCPPESSGSSVTVCGFSLRATLLHKTIRAGYAATLTVPMEPSAADAASRLSFQVMMP
jgi:hypothetical protein